MKKTVAFFKTIFKWAYPFINESINSTKRVIIWMMPFLLGYFYIAYVYYTIEYPLDYFLKTDITSISSSTIFSTFFAGTLAYYGVMYTLTYRVKVEVLSKNRQEWINKVRDIFTTYLYNCSSIHRNITNKSSKDDVQNIDNQISQLYQSSILYLNHKEKINLDILSIMKMMRDRSMMRNHVLDTQHVLNGIPNGYSYQIGNQLYLNNFDNDSIEKLLKIPLPTEYKLRCINLYPILQSDCDEFIKNATSIAKKYNIDINTSITLDELLEKIFIRLTSKVLKEEWERVKKAK